MIRILFCPPWDGSKVKKSMDTSCRGDVVAIVTSGGLWFGGVFLWMHLSKREMHFTITESMNDRS